MDNSISFQAFVEQNKIVSQQVYQTFKKDIYPEKDKIEALIHELLYNIDQETLAHAKQLRNGTESTNVFTFYIMLFSILLSVAFAFFNAHKLREAIDRSTELIRKLSRGEIPERVESSQDELKDVVDASNMLSVNLKSASFFAKSIGDGKFDFEFNPVSKKDVLGNSLIQMRERLQEVAEEDQKRNWATQGLAKFADIIRSNNTDFKSLGENTLIALVEYLGANQGGIFIVNPGDDQSHVFLDMIACYAYDRKKYVNKRVKVELDHADTLLGQVYLEQQKIYLKQIPDGYLHISSGLGEAPAEYLLIIPLQLNDSIEGVLEIASLSPFEDYQVDFIEKICESITSSITTVKVSEHTQTLVKELQQQTEAMRVQEEEMRENMEELTITQEEMRRKQSELETLKNTLEFEVENRTQELQESLTRFNLILQSASEGLWDMIMPENGVIDMDTPFLWSENLKKSFGYPDEEFPNKLQSWASVVHPEDIEEVFKQFLAHVKDQTNTIPFENEHRIKLKSGDYQWFKTSCVTLRDKRGKALRVAGYINNINHLKQLNQVLDELNHKSDLLVESNHKMQANTDILEKALKKTRQKEIELKKTNDELGESKARFNHITKNVPGILYQFEYSVNNNDTGNFVYVSDYVQQFLKYTPEEFCALEKSEIFDKLHPDERQAYMDQGETSVKNLTQFLWEGRILDKEGNWKWSRVKSTPRVLGEVVIMDGIIEDIHESKLQAELLQQKTNEILLREEELRQNYEDLAKMQNNSKES